MFFYPFFVPKPYRVKIRYQLVKSSKEGPLTVWPISLCPVHQGHLVLNWMHLTKPHFVTPLNEHGSIRKVEVKHYQLWRSLRLFLTRKFPEVQEMCHYGLFWWKRLPSSTYLIKVELCTNKQCKFELHGGEKWLSTGKRREMCFK